jgi:site-specific DNA recombinase
MPPHLNSVPDAPPRAIGYVRVSLAREEMISPELQQQAIKDYCSRRGYHLEQIIEDLDASGRNFAREGVQAAIATVENAGVSIVVVWKYSRFGRDRKGWAVNLDRVEAAGGTLESATEEIDTTTSTGRFSRGMLAEIAAWESDRIGEEWQRTHANRRARGLPHSGPPRFGYLYHRTTAPTRDGIKQCPQGCEAGSCDTGYVPDPETAPIAANIYHWYLSGQSARAIAIKLNEQGVPTVRGNPRWNPSAVRNYLHSGFAAGLIRRHPPECKCKAPNTCARNIYTPGTQQTVFENAETGASIWARYWASVERRRRYGARTEAATYTLAGLLACAKCGGPMVAQSKKWPNGRHVRGYAYFCTRSLRARLCTGGSVRRQPLEDAVRTWVNEVADDVTKRSDEVEVEAARTVRKADRTGLLRQQQALASAMTKLTVDLAKGLVPEAAYGPARAELEEESGKLQARLDALGAQETAQRQGPRGDIARNLSMAWPILEVPQRREMLALLINRITIRGLGPGRREVELESAWGEKVILHIH